MNSKQPRRLEDFDAVGMPDTPQLRSQSTDKRLSAVMKAKRKGRDNIFSEKIQVDQPFSPKNFPKSAKTRKLLAQVLKTHYNLHALFTSLSDDLIKLTIDAMQEKKVVAGETIIEQGDSGDFFYVIESGAFEAVKDGKQVATMQEGDPKYNSFGELALLYNCPRAATVRATSAGTVWGLDRLTFRHTLASQDHEQKSNVTASLRSVPLLAELTTSQLNKIADAVQPVHFAPTERIIMKGEPGSIFYIIREGTVACTEIGDGSDRMADVRLKSGEYFGERALLTGEPRACNVHAETETTCLVLDRQGFNELLGPLQDLISMNMRFKTLRSVPLLKNLSGSETQTVAEACTKKTYKAGQYIIKQGDVGKDFFIVSDGSVRVTQTKGKAEADVATLHAGNYFGEMALIGSDRRQANVIAESSVELYTLDRDQFQKLLGPLSEIIKRESERRLSDLGGGDPGSAARAGSPLEDIGLKDLKVYGTLGTGTFGRVKLVQHLKTKKTYALKILQKAHIVAYKQQTNVMSEKNVMVQAQHPFILRLVSTMKDKDQLYMLIELCLGGELFNYLHCYPARGPNEYIPENHNRFYASCVLDAFEYLHDKDIIYRDLKPENLLIDDKGYIKVVDFGFAKKVTDRTYTLCGTPEYLAPELVLGKGHQKGVDYWALGVLIYEMAVGYSAFAGGEQAPDQMVICRNILGGKIEWPAQIQPYAECKSVIQALLKKDVAKRLGCMKGGAKDIKQHAWFKSMNWGKLRGSEIKSPWTPPITNPLDTSHFDPYDDEEEDSQPYRDDGTGWDDDF